MAFAVGDIVEGKVTGLTKFGAFIALPEDKVGMVHISEVSATFVKDIADFLEKGQVVKVKVLSVDENGKISLSIKRAQDSSKNSQSEKSKGSQKNNYKKNYKADKDGSQNQNSSSDTARDKKSQHRSQPNVWQGQKSSYQDSKDMSFEDMMAKFKQQSDDKLSDLKRATESKHGGFSRRGGNKKY